MQPLGPPQADPSTTTSRKALLHAFENAGYLRPFLALAVDLAVFTGGVALVVAITPLSSSVTTPATAPSSKAAS